MSETPTATRPPRAAAVIADPEPAAWAGQVDWSAWYLTDEEDMGEGCEQGEIIRLLLSVLRELVRERAWEDAWVGADNFFAWVEAHPLVRVSPDVYLLRGGPPPPPLPGSWKLWEPGHRAPALAVEIVSEDWRKDYEQGPQKYFQLGVRELLIFDPAAARGLVDAGRCAMQLYRRTEDGAFVRVHRGSAPVWCEAIEACAVVVPTDEGPRLRLARDRAGDDLVASEGERADAEASRADAEASRADAAASRADAAEAALQRLQAELERLRRGTSGDPA